MTFLAFQTTDFLNSHAITFAGFNLIVVLFIHFVAFSFGIIICILVELNFGLSVTIYTPSHRKWCILFNQFHFFNLSMAILASYFTYSYVLCVIEISMISVEQFLKQNAIVKIDFLKIDTQGNDLNILDKYIQMLLCIKRRFIKSNYLLNK